MRTREQEVEPFVNLSELSEIELLMLKQMREYTLGDHRSVFHGSGFDFLGLRDWQPGDRPSNVDWPQSAIKGFSPLVVREFEQPSTGSVIVVADRSLSTGCGAGRNPIAASVARAIGTIGMSAVFFQDTLGLITFDSTFRGLKAVPPRTGKNQVVQCLDAYQTGRATTELKDSETFSTAVEGFMRRTTMIPVLSDFLFDTAQQFIRQLASLNVVHDVFVVMLDSAYAYQMPGVSEGWVRVYDVENGKTAVVSRKMFVQLARRASEWQDRVESFAKDANLDVVRLGLDDLKNTIALSKFTGERRLRRR